MNRIDLQVYLAENPRPSKPIPVLTCADYRYKLKLCKTCPHRYTPRNYGADAYFRLRLWLDRIVGKGVNEPHPCHDHDGCYCAGHAAEIKVKLAKQARKYAMVKKTLEQLIHWLTVAIGWLVLGIIGLVFLFVYLFHGGSDDQHR